MKTVDKKTGTGQFSSSMAVSWGRLLLPQFSGMVNASCFVNLRMLTGLQMKKMIGNKLV
jgi:hypothetical protein